jgi:hypothetical protein
MKNKSKNFSFYPFFILAFPVVFLAFGSSLNIFLAKTAKATEPRFCNHYNFKAPVIKINIYDIDLCNDQKPKLSYAELWQNPFTIIIKYNRNIKKEQLVSNSVKEIKKYNKIDAFEEKNIEKKLTELFPNIAKDDVISAFYNKDTINFKYNEKEIGNIYDAKLAREFINIWLNPKNEFNEMRNALLK